MPKTNGNKVQTVAHRTAETDPAEQPVGSLPKKYPSPFQVLVATAATVLLAESAIMLSLAIVGPLHPLLALALDSLALIILVFPALYLSIYRPMQTHIAESKRAEESIQKLNRELERRIAELAASNRELEMFSSSVSHDLRSPLQVIDGFSQVLREDYDDRLDERGRDYLARIRTVTAHMAQLIDDLLDLSGVTRVTMRREPVDLSRVAQGIAHDLQRREPERRVEFAVAEGLVAEGDARLLRIALENLLRNAWKFTSTHAQARIRFGAVADAGGPPAYFVSDDGVGFDMAYAAKLFVPFSRLHTTDEFPGTGIGLGIVQRIVQRHGGRVWAQGAVEQGATFYFTLNEHPAGDK